MREIKFRAWEKTSKEMVYDVQNVSRKRIIGESACESFQEVIESWEYEIMQYTGLKDKNGREIYEGDIVRIWGGEYWYGYWEVDVKGEVVFDDFSYGVKSDDRFYPFNIAFEAYDYEIEVIGNIYENPELLGDLIG